MSIRYEDRFWTSGDGLRLHYRDYPGPAPDAHAANGTGARLPVLCLHGLTRNARDFAPLAERLSPEWRILVPEMRGRGDSEYARDAETYAIPQYLSDLGALLEAEGLERVIAVGTSMGGLMTMALAAAEPRRIAGAVLNDIGPKLEPGGLERIMDYVGQGRTYPTWVHAARALEEAHGDAHPGRDLSYWIGKAKQLMAVGGSGRIVFDYDMKVAEPFAGLAGGEQADLWAQFAALAPVPVTVLRGERSDLFSRETFLRMGREHPDCELVEVPEVGHCPDLTEPEALAAIDRLLARVDIDVPA